MKISTMNLDYYYGKIIERFEDSQGNILCRAEMVKDLVIVFIDGDRLPLSLDWRGCDCYISQYEGEI